MSSSRKRQAGQSLVETSLVLITLLLMIIGNYGFRQFLFFNRCSPIVRGPAPGGSYSGHGDHRDVLKLRRRWF